MAINQIFPSPTVKQVLFEVKFPNLFYLENKIGDLQMKVMERFPESALLVRRQVVFADLGPDSKATDLPIDTKGSDGKKIWQFKSPKKYVLNITTNSLDITSDFHKTYQLEGGDKFRDIIEFVIKHFLAALPIPTFTRVGLRYIDECPVLAKNNVTISSYYNTTFPLSRFNISDATEMDFKAVVKRGETFLRYVESLRTMKDSNEYQLVMDFDGFRENVDTGKYLQVLDEIHTVLSSEFENSIKQPLVDFMNKHKQA